MMLTRFDTIARCSWFDLVVMMQVDIKEFQMTKKQYIANRIKLNVVYIILLVAAITLASIFLGPPTDYATPIIIIVIGIAFMEFWGYKNWQRRNERLKK